jgi:hypothetical protein
VIETWDQLKVTGREFTRFDMRKFVEMMNDRTKQIVRIFRIEDIRFYQELASQATLAITWLEWLLDMTQPDMPDNEKVWGRQFVALFGVDKVSYYTSLVELCVNAQTQLTEGARLIADGIDRTNV